MGLTRPLRHLEQAFGIQRVEDPTGLLDRRLENLLELLARPEARLRELRRAVADVVGAPDSPSQEVFRTSSTNVFPSSLMECASSHAPMSRMIPFPRPWLPP
jgi:hypothetical protein